MCCYGLALAYIFGNQIIHLLVLDYYIIIKIDIMFFQVMINSITDPSSVKIGTTA